MTKAEREEALKRAEAALRKGNAERKGEIRDLRGRDMDMHEYGEALLMAGRRGMLEELVIDTMNGGERRLMAIKEIDIEPEPYKKRPSVRAARKHRQKTAGPGV